jgi:hypothetical protein
MQPANRTEPCTATASTTCESRRPPPVRECPPPGKGEPGERERAPRRCGPTMHRNPVVCSARRPRAKRRRFCAATDSGKRGRLGQRTQFDDQRKSHAGPDAWHPAPERDDVGQREPSPRGVPRAALVERARSARRRRRPWARRICLPASLGREDVGGSRPPGLRDEPRPRADDLPSHRARREGLRGLLDASGEARCFTRSGSSSITATYRPHATRCSGFMS